jgi:hypothetical protein
MKNQFNNSVTKKNRKMAILRMENKKQWMKHGREK